MSRGTDKIPITIMIGNGSKLPKLIKAANSPTSKFKITLVVSHKKQSDGVKLALKHNIPAVYLNFVDWSKRTKKSRSEYMKYLGWFISQSVYKPKLLVFAGWDLIMDQQFFNFFKCNFGSGFSAINLHPALMMLKGEEQIKLPDDSKILVIKGEQEEVLKKVLGKKHSYFGPSIHFMVPINFDTGELVAREFIKVGKSKTIEQLRKKLSPVEDRLLLKSINKVIAKHL